MPPSMIRDFADGVSSTVRRPTILHDSGTRGGVILAVRQELLESRAAAEYNKRCISNNKGAEYDERDGLHVLM